MKRTMTTNLNNADDADAKVEFYIAVCRPTCGRCRLLIFHWIIGRKTAFCLTSPSTKLIGRYTAVINT